jgi:hypothetical protein
VSALLAGLKTMRCLGGALQQLASRGPFKAEALPAGDTPMASLAAWQLGSVYCADLLPSNRGVCSLGARSSSCGRRSTWHIERLGLLARAGE